ncbi:MAG: hypothetical protein KDD82_22895 [Planctomycetes bacterium]|nr:hypothetical protein [Planctomycetota bacterium]
MRISVVLALGLLPRAVLAQAEDPGLPPPPLRGLSSVQADARGQGQGPSPEFLGPTPEEQAAAEAAAERTAVTAIAEYLTRLFVEDSQLDADLSLPWQTSDGVLPGGGVRLQFKSALLSGEADLGYFDPAQRGYKLAFTDFVGERFKVRASVDRSFLELGGSTAARRFDNHAVSYQVNPETVVEFEVFLRQDEAVGSYRDSFRAIVKRQVGDAVFRVGLDRSYNGAPFENGELNAVAGVDLPPLLLRSERHYLKLSTSVEVMAGRSDSQAPGIRNARTLGLAQTLGAEVGANDRRWVLGVGAFGEQTREGLGDGLGEQNRVTATGAWLYGSWQVSEDRRLFANAKRSSLRTQLFGGDQEVQRSTFELGLETALPSGSRWRVGLNAGKHEAPGGDGWSTGVTVGFSF